MKLLGVFFLLSLLAPVGNLFASDFTCKSTASFRVHPAYRELTQKTGGSLIGLPSSEFGTVDLFASQRFLGKMEQDVVRRLEFGPGDVLTFSGSFSSIHKEEFWIDGVSSRLVIDFNSTKPASLSVFDVDGALIADSANNTIQSYSTGCLVLISGPRAGKWRLETQSDGEVQIGVKVRSPVHFHAFEFVELRGMDFAHLGYSPLKQRPKPGSKFRADATIFGTNVLKKIKDFEFRDAHGKIISKISYNSEPDINWHYLLPSIKVPDYNSYVYVYGIDHKGFQFQRVIPIND